MRTNGPADLVGADLGDETREMNGVFEDLVAASMSRVRLRIPGLEFYRGLRGRDFMVAYFQQRIAEARAREGDGSRDGRGGHCV